MREVETYKSMTKHSGGTRPASGQVRVALSGFRVARGGRSSELRGVVASARHHL